ncbi:hypothetical protein [Streptomyces sp. NBC_00388]|uniref:hypothetical protein n=1 Tax=Streptomyces sp. NBC_00388 TaxID=2975735 RepID=UPI002E1F1D24
MALRRDIDRLQRHLVRLEHELAAKADERDERTEELETARAANHELTRALNSGPG